MSVRPDNTASKKGMYVPDSPINAASDEREAL